MEISLDLIQRVLREEDIEGFIASGAPEDEYNSEAHRIADKINQMNHVNEQMIVAIISKVWQRCLVFRKVIC